MNRFVVISLALLIINLYFVFDGRISPFDWINAFAAGFTTMNIIAITSK